MSKAKCEFMMKNGNVKEITMKSGEVIELQSDDMYEIYDIVEGIKALWRGSANYIPESVEDARIEVGDAGELGSRVIKGRARIEGDLNIDGKNIMFIECNINQVSIEIGVNDVEISDNGKVKIKDKQDENGVIQALAFKKSLNKILSEYKIEGSLSKDKVGKGSIKSDLHLVDKNGRRISHDELPDENYMIVTLALLMCQYVKYVNVIFIDMGGVKEEENIVNTLQWISDNNELNRNNYVIVHNNYRNMRVSKRVYRV